MSKKRNRSARNASGRAQEQRQETVKAEAAKEPKQETEKTQETQEVQEAEKHTEASYSEDAYAAAEEVLEEQPAAPAAKETPADGQETEETPVKVQKEKEELPEQEKKQPDRLFGMLIRKMIFCAALGIFFYALSGLLVLLWGYYSSQKEYRELNEDTVVIGTTAAPENSSSNPGELVVDISGGTETETDTRAPYLEISVQEDKLRALNQDYAFYIVIPGTSIQYPVVQGEDNNHYLRYTYSNQENTAGAIALDYRTERSTYLQTFNIIISGHNRQDGTMFSDLANYQDESFRDEHPYVYIVMDGKEYVYEFYSFYAMEPVAVCYNPNTADDVYLDFTNENNTYTNDIEVTLDDHIITMYTCNEDSSMRYLCHAVLRDVYDLK